MKRIRLTLCFALTFALVFTAGVYTSIAEESAENGTLVFGDANGDDKVNSTDLACLKRYIEGTISDFPGKEASYTMDVSFDGVINTTDSSYLKRYIIEVIPELPAREAMKKMPEKVFEYRNVNNAWSSYDDGFYVDNKGNVHVFDNIKKKEKIVKNIPINELQKNYVLLKKASKGSLSEPKSEMCDAGIITFTGYIQDGDTTQKLLLYQGGDVLQYNESQYTEFILGWMESLLTMEELFDAIKSL